MASDDRQVASILLPLHIAHISDCPVLASAVQSTSPDGAIEGLVQSRGRSAPTFVVRLLGTARGLRQHAPAHASTESEPCVSSSPSGGRVAARWMSYSGAEGGYTPLVHSRCLEGPVRAGLQPSSTRQASARLNLCPLVLLFWS